MPWREVSIVDQRREFVQLAIQEGANRRELCRRFGIHPDTGYKWLGRAEEELSDRSRRPRSSPARTAAVIETRILALRDAHPAWGARKIAHCLKREAQPARHIRRCTNPAPAWPDGSATGRPCGSPSLREARAQSTLADGFQGSHAVHGRRAVPSLDRGRRSFAL